MCVFMLVISGQGLGELSYNIVLIKDDIRLLCVCIYACDIRTGPGGAII